MSLNIGFLIYLIYNLLSPSIVLLPVIYWPFACCLYLIQQTSSSILPVFDTAILHCPTVACIWYKPTRTAYSFLQSFSRTTCRCLSIWVSWSWRKPENVFSTLTDETQTQELKVLSALAAVLIKEHETVAVVAKCDNDLELLNFVVMINPWKDAAPDSLQTSLKQCGPIIIRTHTGWA